MQQIRQAHLVLAFAFVGGVVIQVFLAGLGVFDAYRVFLTHASFGYLLELVALALVVLAVAGRLGRRQVIYACALFAMFMLQSVLVAVRGDLPVVAALHAVNGFAILLVGIFMARDAWRDRRGAALARVTDTPSLATGLDHGA